MGNSVVQINKRNKHMIDDDYNMIKIINRSLAKDIRESLAEDIEDKMVRELKNRIKPLIKEHVEKINFAEIIKYSDAQNLRDELVVYLKINEDEKQEIKQLSKGHP